MSPCPDCPTPVRSAAELNRLIRALLRRSRGRRMTAADRAEYERLRAEWVKAA